MSNPKDTPMRPTFPYAPHTFTDSSIYFGKTPVYSLICLNFKSMQKTENAFKSAGIGRGASRKITP
ncbi:hypothetical protein [Oscillibacter ruminantium]|nr:hypothetical protein [Oscillibacter valericigenes]